jgi:hypothetical protein
MSVLSQAFTCLARLNRVLSLFKRDLWLMQLIFLEMFAFKTYLGLARIAKNMALMAGCSNVKKVH